MTVSQWLIAATLLVYGLALFTLLGAMAVGVILVAAAAAALGANVATGTPARVAVATAVNVLFGSYLAMVLAGFTADASSPPSRETLELQLALGWLLLLVAVNVAAAAVHLKRSATWRR